MTAAGPRLSNLCHSSRAVATMAKQSWSTTAWTTGSTIGR